MEAGSSRQAQEEFDRLKTFTDEDFKPPEWATGPAFSWATKKEGESSTFKSEQRSQGRDGRDRGAQMARDESENGDSDSGSDEEDEVWEDALDGSSDTEQSGDLPQPEAKLFSNAELKALLDKALEHKTLGNASFQAKPPDLDDAINQYHLGLDCLPEPPKQVQAEAKNQKSGESKANMNGGSCIEEITEEEAIAIEQANGSEPNSEEDERNRLEDEMRDCIKACWGNLGACYLAQNRDKEAVEACTKAIKIDPLYTKALQRRATANERLNSWSSLTAAQEDYETLLKLVTPNSAQATSYRSKVRSLPARVKVQQEKEKDEMLSKLKDLGNSLLGNFGLSTDNFKFDQQEGGGYSMRFER